MKFSHKLLSGAALALALSNTAFANTYTLLSKINEPTFSITITTAADASTSAQKVTAISGQISGSDITGFSSYFAKADNLFKFSATDNTQWFSASGLSISTANGLSWLLATPTGKLGKEFLSATNNLGNFTSVSRASATDTTPAASAVPEPEAYAMMLAGLGLVGFAARRNKQAA